MRPFLIGFVLWTCLLFTGSAEAQQVNVDRATIAQHLLTQHGEEPVSMALADGGMLELFSTPGGETWTLILTMPDGKVFFIGNGTDWENFPPLKKGTAL